MLRTNYCTFELQDAIFIVIRSSIVKRDLSFSFIIVVIVFHKKVFFYFFSQFVRLVSEEKKFFFSYPNLFETFHYNNNVESE